MVDEGATVEPGMEAYTVDDTDLGPVKRVWRNDGSVQPPEETPVTGTFSIDPGGHGETGYFLVARVLAPDWYVPFSAIQSVIPGRVVLAVTIEEAQRRSWQEPPA